MQSAEMNADAHTGVATAEQSRTAMKSARVVHMSVPPEATWILFQGCAENAPASICEIPDAAGTKLCCERFETRYVFVCDRRVFRPAPRYGGYGRVSSVAVARRAAFLGRRGECTRRSARRPASRSRPN